MCECAPETWTDICLRVVIAIFPEPRPLLPLAAHDTAACLQPLKELLLDRAGSSLSAAALSEINSMNFADLRDKLLTFGSLDVEWVKKVDRGA